MASQARRVEPLRPAWPICSETLVSPLAWMKSTMRCQAPACASFQMPVQPGVMRASAATQVISVTSSAAPPMPRLP